jgi:protocatechuate 3,4-dioxygenase beta subunit
MSEPGLTRRGSLVRVGGFAAALFGVGGWRLEEEADGAGPAAVASGAVKCVLTPEQTEGPYYIPNERVRRNITEGRPGTVLLLRTTVVDASTCRPIKRAAVDIWHADAAGEYSGFGQRAGSRTFMRGVQRTNARGLATFQTVYPGWYPGRTVHIHVKVHIGGNVVHTGQLYFPDAITDAAYRTAPYNKRPGRNTRNATDSVYRNGGKRSTLTVRKSANGYVAAIAMGVHRS